MRGSVGPRRGRTDENPRKLGWAATCRVRTVDPYRLFGEAIVPTLHIEHAITDFGVWVAAFAKFEEVRRTAGVRDARVHQPVDDPNLVVVDLDFDTRDDAT